MMWLRQSTASQEIKLGPFLDSTDGNTTETGLTIANTDIKLTKHGATTETNKNSGGGTHVAAGRYSAVLDATDTNTLGHLEVDVHVAGALASHREYMVLPSEVYDALVLGTDILDVNLTQWLGTAAATPDTAGIPHVNVSHVANTSQTAGDLAALLTVIDTVVDAIKVVTDKFVFTVANQVDSNVITKTGFSLASTGLDSIVSTATGMVEIAKAVWDRILSGATHNIATSAGRRLRGIQDFQGYEDGSIWVDTLNGTAGTTDYENGTVENAVLTWADALTLNTSLGLNKFRIANGSTITLTAAITNYTMMGENWTLVLAVNSIANAHIHGCSDISGVSSGTNYKLVDCKFGSTISLASGWSRNCRINGTITLVGTGGFFFQSCFSTTGTIPVIDLQSGVGAQTVCLTPLTGGVQFNNIEAGDVVHLEGFGEWTLSSSCTAGDFEVAGDWRETDSSGGTTISRGKTSQNAIDILAHTTIIEAESLNKAIAAPVAGSAWDILNDLDALLPAAGELSTLTAANINTEVLDVMAVDTYSEPGQATPPATTTLAVKINYLYKGWRNKKDCDGTTNQLYNDDASTVDQKQTVSESAGTSTKGEWITGP